MRNQEDPLATLFKNDAKMADRQKLAELLAPFIIIDEASRELSFHGAFHKLKSNTQKIEIILAATKAISLFFNEPDGLLPGKILALHIMPEGSAKTSLKRLFDAHKIKRDNEGRYFIPSYRIPDLINPLNKESTQ